MKKIVLATALLVGISALPLLITGAENTDSSQAQDAGQKEQYEKSMKERFRKLGKELDELKAKSRSTTEQARKEMDRSIADAEKKRKEAARKLDELRRESKKKWKEFTDDLNAAMDEFEKAFERAKSQFKQPSKT